MWKSFGNDFTISNCTTESNNRNCVVGREGITCKDSLMSAITATDSEFCSTSHNCLMLHNHFSQCCYIWVVGFGGLFWEFLEFVLVWVFFSIFFGCFWRFYTSKTSL